MFSRKFWLWLILAPVCGFIALATLGNHIIVRQKKHQVDMKSGRVRTIERHFWKVTEGEPEDTWISLALRASRNVEPPADWRSQSTETDTLWGKMWACKPGGPFSSLGGGTVYSVFFTPEAEAIIAADLLRYSDGTPDERRRWRDFETSLQKTVSNAADTDRFDAEWTRALRSKFFPN